ncbi:translocation/assembly module TamB domain-containing protein [Stutzerimonas azotifigens]|uniref:translocation/assembly module TamB domain-containing protein n=1 Tax=Stutzerimonas azotifigens TaxID=291995 RepID=UPI0004285E28|nr:translocation/assembly module TamB domain-containing protein [Stutzerimonas azotifigens]
MRRALGIAAALFASLLALLLAVLFVAGTGLALVLGTEGGSRWVLARVPGLELSGFQGRLGGRWQAERLVWSQDGQRVEVDSPVLQWSPGCLLQLTLCIDELLTGDIRLDFPPRPEDPAAADEPFSLPDVRLPLAIRVDRLDIGTLDFNGTQQLRDLQLVARWRAEGLDIERLTVERDDLSATFDGRLLPSGQWPLTLDGQALVQVPGQEALNLEIAVEGDLRERLRLAVDSDGYFTGRLAGHIEPLDERLPATLQLTSEAFKALPDLPDTLRLEQLELTASGNLADGYRLLGTGQLPGTGGPVRLALQGVVDQAGAVLDTLELDAGRNRSLRLEGRAGWEEGIEAHAQLAWQAFPWTWLYPEIDEPPVTLRRATAEIDYDDGNYLGHFDAALSGPAGDFTLASPVSGDLGSVNLPQLQLVAGQGSASGSVGVRFADALSWRADLALSRLDPAYWVAELPGQLGGTLKSTGSLADGALQAHADLALDGRLRGQPTTLRLQADAEGEQWRLPLLNLQVGDNRIQGSGRWGDSLEARLELALSRLGQLWPGLEGQLSGELTAAGTPDAPRGRLALNGQSLGFDGNGARALQLSATLDGGERLALDLSGEGLHAGETDLGTLRVNADGTQKAHQASLQLQGPTANVALGLSGSLAEDLSWRGRLLRATLEAVDQRWALREPAAITRRADGRLDLAAHCWISDPASLCADDQRLMPEPQLRYRLRDFPLARLAAYLPEDFAWDGELNADLDLQLPAAGPSGKVSVDAGPGTLRMREADHWIDFPYATLALDADLAPDQVNADLAFEGGELGELAVSARIDPRGEAKPLEGTFRLSGLNLAVARPFAPQVERLEGALDGSGRLTGTLTEPQVLGQLELSGGHIGGGQLPTTFEDLRIAVNIEGESLDIDGDWRSGEQGRGRLNGTLAWQEALDLDLRIAGERLPVVVEPYAELEVEPDVRVTFGGGRLAVTGRVEVPRGDIRVRELPPSTVEVSEDAVIIGEEAGPQAQPLNMEMSVDVVVGEDRLNFSGFGLTAQLRGFMHIGNNLDTRGELNLVNGRYRAYGQRLNIRRARLLFTGPVSQPFLDIEAIRRIEEDDVIAGIRITGSAAQPRTEVFSEPTMSQEQALSYLILGRPLGADSGDSSLLAQAALGLGLAGGSRLGGGLASRLGIEDFQLDTQGSGDETSVVASGRLTERLSLRYGVGVFAPANTIALRYRLTRRIFLEAASGLASSLDIFYRRDF